VTTDRRSSRNERAKLCLATPSSHEFLGARLASLAASSSNLGSGSRGRQSFEQPTPKALCPNKSDVVRAEAASFRRKHTLIGPERVLRSVSLRSGGIRVWCTPTDVLSYYSLRAKPYEGLSRPVVEQRRRILDVSPDDGGCLAGQGSRDICPLWAVVLQKVRDNGAIRTTR
jgi:hypothetical protein